ncbi:hypothetical protein ABID58_005347 [Bradyrhizobium sp. S3.2.6]|uniref:hypothetical protein n=1 Tax=Bradyrhizobium sp. S3.2.6 TaxID=3156428 RepID=UPI0033974AAB
MTLTSHTDIYFTGEGIGKLLATRNYFSGAMLDIIGRHKDYIDSDFVGRLKSGVVFEFNKTATSIVPAQTENTITIDRYTCDELIEIDRTFREQTRLGEMKVQVSLEKAAEAPERTLRMEYVKGVPGPD